MNGSVLVICPRGGSGENFAAVMAKELTRFSNINRVGFSYPYLAEYQEGNQGLLQQLAAVIRDKMEEGVTEFLFADTGLTPVLADIKSMLPAEAEPVIYDPIDEARANFLDPQERPLWLDRWQIMERIAGFETLFSQDRTDLKDLIEEVIFRTRGVTGGNTEHVPDKFRADLLDEEFLRKRAAQLLFRLVERPTKNGMLLGNVDLAIALTRYIDEEFREFIEQCNFVQLAQVLAIRII